MVIIRQPTEKKSFFPNRYDLSASEYPDGKSTCGEADCGFAEISDGNIDYVTVIDSGDSDCGDRL
jgi:hypothetical protein